MDNVENTMLRQNHHYWTFANYQSINDTCNNCMDSNFYSNGHVEMHVDNTLAVYDPSGKNVHQRPSTSLLRPLLNLGNLL